MKEVFRKYFGTVTLGFAVVIALYQAFFIHHQMLAHAGNVCIMDSIRLVLANRNSSIVIILVVVWYMYITKNDYDTLLIIRMKSKKYLWKMQCKKILKISFVITLCIMINGIINGMLHSKDWLNWSSQASYYSSGTEPQGIFLTTNISIGQIIILAFLFLYIQIAITLCFVVLVYWGINSYIVSLVVIVVVAIGDAYTSFGPIFYRRFRITNNDWSTFDISLWIKLFTLLAILATIMFLGTLIAERKEFIGEEEL